MTEAHTVPNLFADCRVAPNWRWLALSSYPANEHKKECRQAWIRTPERHQRVGVRAISGICDLDRPA